MPLYAGHHRLARKCHLIVFCWRAYDGPTLNSGLVAAIFRGSGPVLLETLINIFVIFQGGPNPLSSSG